ncbi:hypothetical protein K469DRAFT_540786, partial [Zopfia rhizophila CBS 207.26]
RKATTHWAVIIGVNYYPEHYDRCLKGCVQDAEATKSYLGGAIEINANLVVLAASTPSVPGVPPPEKPEEWPTCPNVIAQLRRIIDEAECGDRVYIHYSGHGTRLLSRDKRPELALVLLDCDGRKSKCLRSVTLAQALQKMVKKGLVVTLVLDCCFSGGVVRSSDYRGFDVRFLEPDTAFAINELDTIFSEASSTFRDASMEDWLIDPKGYTILSACAPDQKAFEIEMQGERRGALTHFLLGALHTLRVNGIKLAHHSLHEHLSTSFHAYWPQQTPMRYGNANLSFFGDSLLAPENGFVPIYRKVDGRLYLRAGDVHGVFKGDEYFAYPFDTPEHANGQVEEGTANVRVTAVRFFESDLMEIGPTTIVRQIQTGWKAKPLTSLSPWTINIGLLPSLTRNGQLEIPAKGLRYARLVTRQGTEEHPTEEACMYNVAVNHNEYEVVNALFEKMLPIPTISCSSDGAAKVLVNVLQHMAKFKYFEGVENRASCTTFQASFSLDSKCPAGNANRIGIKHDAKWSFTAKNKSYKKLYMGIFNLRPSWEVKSLTSASGGGTYLIIPAKKNGIDGERQLSMTMRVPEFLLKDSITECEDIIKVFITSKPTSF